MPSRAGLKGFLLHHGAGAQTGGHGDNFVQIAETVVGHLPAPPA
jgi:hypothetical protein